MMTAHVMKRVNTRVAQAVVQQLLYLSQNQQKVCVQFFNWLILNVPPAAAPRNNVLSQACMGDRENGVLC
jgi:hypothetical protein